MTPLIGITTYSDVARWRDWAVPAAVLPRTYVDAVRRGGGRPVLLPPGGTAAEAALTLADLDGLVVAGGEDVDPARYGATMHPATGRPNAERDAWELALLDSALEAGCPLLAVCRGMQLLNVIRGGTLHQHLPHIVGHEEHSGFAEDFGRHMVRIGEAGQIGKILSPNGTSRDEAAPNGAGAGGADQEGFDWPSANGHWLEVPTHHHQAVDQLGDGLVATAWAADGTVEAVEFTAASAANGAGFAIGVQWHPEEGQDPRLFRALIDAARRFSERRSIPGSLRSRNRRCISPGGSPPCRTVRSLSPTRCSARSGPAPCRVNRRRRTALGRKKPRQATGSPQSPANVNDRATARSGCR
jgi:putative glutamine amidotransferase